MTHPSSFDMNDSGSAKTYPTKCRDCGEAIFFHTNGYGDVVFFDDLGAPWPIHGCYEAHPGGRPTTDRTAYRAFMVSVYGRPFKPRMSKGVPTRGFSGRELSRKQPVQSNIPERPLDIARCDPSHFLGQ
jgi:hypothetical protein